MPDETPITPPTPEPARGPDGKFLPATASAPEAPATPAEEPKPKARDHAEFARRRRALEDKARAVREREMRLQEQDRQRQERDAQRDQELATMRAKLEAWEKGNPLAVAHAAGRDIDAAVREYVQGETPEAIGKRALEEAKALREELKRRDETTAKERQELQRQAEARAHQVRKAAFVADILRTPDKFPYLHHEFDENQLADIVHNFDAWAAQEGKSYTYEQAASELERLAKQRYDLLEPKRSALFRDQKNPSAPAPVSAGSGNGQPAKSPATARRSVDPDPKPKPKHRALSRDEEAEADLAMLRQAIAKDRAANGRA